jgi:hypothetical protein
MSIQTQKYLGRKFPRGGGYVYTGLRSNMVFTPTRRYILGATRLQKLVLDHYYILYFHMIYSIL